MKKYDIERFNFGRCFVKSSVSNKIYPYKLFLCEGYRSCDCLQCEQEILKFWKINTIADEIIRTII